MNSFKKPNLNAPRFREPRIGLLNKEFIKEFRKKHPEYSEMSDNLIKQVVMTYNKKIVESAINHRDGVELPESLGYIFIGTCPPAKKSNPDFNLSKDYGKVLQNKNWETDGNIGKIFYTNFASKYRFKNRELWMIAAHRDFRRSVSKSYVKNWMKYRVITPKTKVSKLYIDEEELKEELKNYNEFSI